MNFEEFNQTNDIYYIPDLILISYKNFRLLKLIYW